MGNAMQNVYDMIMFCARDEETGIFMSCALGRHHEDDAEGFVTDVTIAARISAQSGQAASACPPDLHRRRTLRWPEQSD